MTRSCLFASLIAGSVAAATASPPVTIAIDTPMAAPRWAHLERAILSASVPACREFFRKYYDDRGYLQAFLRTRRGSVRMVFGEAGSNCCGTVAARHPNRFTYTGVLPYSIYGTVPPPAWLRGFSSRRLDCQGRQQLCALFEGRAADRTRWVGI